MKKNHWLRVVLIAVVLLPICLQLLVYVHIRLYPIANKLWHLSAVIDPQGQRDAYIDSYISTGKTEADITFTYTNFGYLGLRIFLLSGQDFTGTFLAPYGVLPGGRVIVNNKRLVCEDGFFANRAFPEDEKYISLLHSCFARVRYKLVDDSLYLLAPSGHQLNFVALEQAYQWRKNE